ncbi:OLC1v1009515C1 [Oldenlandia corymbosa var. corymbosa]|uniref:OLC1v1009515C1 n=1 Tax=Oldenlandia corymbosa var. corymbosa TaxID=529605 RepID=A0AAV1DPN2_OLDCO|nr:OLC1v1009515C1 [Oldenlandia corymbosa var. corymbosa]
MVGPSAHKKRSTQRGRRTGRARRNPPPQIPVEIVDVDLDDWVIRREGASCDPDLAYARGSKYFTIRIHHGGQLKDTTPWEYISGKVSYLDKCHAANFNLHNMSASMVGLGYDRESIVFTYYRHLEKDYNVGLHPLVEHSHLREFLKFSSRLQDFGLYCNHYTKEQAEERFNEDQGKICDEFAEKEYNAVRKEGTLLLGRKNEVDQEFLDLLQMPFKNACGTSEVTPEGEVADPVNSSNAQGIDISIPVPNHQDSTVPPEVGHSEEQLLGKCQPGVAGSISLNRDQLEEVANDEFIRQHGGRIATGYDGVHGVAEDQQLHKQVGREGTLHEDEPDNDVETLDRVYKLCSDEVLFDEFVSNMMTTGTADTYFNVQSFDRDTSWVTQPDVGDHEARTKATLHDNSGSTEGLHCGKTLKGESAKRGDGRIYTQPKRVVKEQRPDGGTDSKQENANVEPHKKPNSEDDGDAQAGCFTDFQSLDGVPQFRIAYTFRCKNDFKHAIKSYMMLTGRPVYMYTNDSTRLRAQCVAPCKWFVYAKKTTVDGIECFYMHSIRDIHTDCTPENTNKKDENAAQHSRLNSAFRKQKRNGTTAADASSDEPIKATKMAGRSPEARNQKHSAVEQDNLNLTLQTKEAFLVRHRSHHLRSRFLMPIFVVVQLKQQIRYAANIMSQEVPAAPNGDVVDSEANGRANDVNNKTSLIAGRKLRIKLKGH